MSRKKSNTDQKKLIRIKKKYQDLQERYDQMDDYLLELMDTNKYIQEELRYFRDFIAYKNQEDEYAYFKAHAHEEKDMELPFPSLVL